jgi:hypothetical protein
LCPFCCDGLGVQICIVQTIASRDKAEVLTVAVFLQIGCYLHAACLHTRESSEYRRHSSNYKTAYTDARKAYRTVTVYNSLPEGEPPGSKHVEDIRRLKTKILIREICI